MNILFISSGNSGKISPIVKSQGNSLIKNGLNVEYFQIQGKGIKGYFKSIFKLRKHLKQNDYDIIHAHYSLSGFVASLSGAKKVVVSLMGDDVLTSRLLFVTKLFAKYGWEKAIVKSKGMKVRLESNSVEVIPNGVDLTTFIPIENSHSQKDLGFSKEQIHLLFAASPKRKVKNFNLFKAACDVLKMNGQSIEIHCLDNISHEQIPIYMNAADVVCLSSLSEGSPNVIKEAMACNRPIVSTDVGDVKEIIGNTEGCFISSNEPEQFSVQIRKAVHFSQEHNMTNGRERILHLGLDEDSVAKRIVEVYEKML